MQQLSIVRAWLLWMAQGPVGHTALQQQHRSVGDGSECMFVVTYTVAPQPMDGDPRIQADMCSTPLGQATSAGHSSAVTLPSQHSLAAAGLMFTCNLLMYNMRDMPALHVISLQDRL